MEADRFLTESLRKASWGPQVTEIMAAALNAVDPYRAVRAWFKTEGEALLFGDESYALDEIEHIFVVGAGKAGLPMARAVADVLGERIDGGLVIVKQGYGGVDHLGAVAIREAGHPLPDARGVEATQELLELLSGAGENDLVVCVISGGGSALLTAPVEGFSLDDLRELTEVLLASGAAIEEINALRKQLDTVKGGGLARAAFPARVIGLILSDVVGDPLEMIASGPTVEDTPEFDELSMIIWEYDLWDYLPEGILGDIDSGEGAGTSVVFERVLNVLVGTNRLAAQAAAEEAIRLGLGAEILTTELQGEASRAGVRLSGILKLMAETGLPLGKPGVLIAGGETTVTLQGSGVGGRNQELALAAVEGLAGLEDVALVALATDGGDGASEAAGAVVTGESLARARELGMEPEEYLKNNDSDAFFKALEDQLLTGPTQTNVNDLVFLFVC